MNEVLRPTLLPGARVAIVSPASAARPELIEEGCRALERFGYRAVVMPHACARGPMYYAGRAEDRAQDLHSALTDPAFDGVFCTRGGWGSAELLPLLDAMGTADVLRRRPKVFVGYSDHSSLLTWLWNSCRITGFYAPMVAADWSRPDGVELRSWTAAMQAEPYSLGAPDGLRVLREGSAAARLQGGCLAILEASLGTPWSFAVDEPCLLFVEDIGVKPYQWDRMLQHLRLAGLLQGVQGVVLGDMSANVTPDEMPLLEAACLHALRGIEGPIAIGLRCGHVTTGNRSLVLGEQAKLLCTQGEVSLHIGASRSALAVENGTALSA